MQADGRFEVAEAQGHVSGSGILGDPLEKEGEGPADPGGAPGNYAVEEKV